MVDIKTQLETLTRGASECIFLEEKLKAKPVLRVKLGVDPTAADLHLGHTVILNKLRQFQDFGHEIYFILGDFTSSIGDPTGKNKTRPALEMAQILENAKTYEEQVFKILDKDKTKVVFNSTWSNALGSLGMVKLAAKYTVARMLERDDFKNRFANNTPIALHEFLYPLMQGYDSIAIEADVELGGNDQKFNLLVGRELQKDFGQEQQAILTMPLLVGTDGEHKMSKSLGNYIGIAEQPNDMFGKVMSISDDLMWEWYTYLSFLPTQEINALKEQVLQGENPRNVKIKLAKEIVARFHSQEAADLAEQNFINQFSKNIIPTDIVTYQVSKTLTLTQALKDVNLVGSTSEALRLLKQGAIKLDGNKVADNVLVAGTYQVGKRKFAILELVD